MYEAELGVVGRRAVAADADLSGEQLPSLVFRDVGRVPPARSLLVARPLVTPDR